MEVIHTTADLEVRRKSGRHLIIVKPELEDRFLWSMRRAALQPKLPSHPKELQTLLNLPKHPAHRLFREGLSELHKVATAQKISTFITDLERIIQTLL